jgi:hypothetical protein
VETPLKIVTELLTFTGFNDRLRYFFVFHRANKKILFLRHTYTFAALSSSKALSAITVLASSQKLQLYDSN